MMTGTREGSVRNGGARAWALAPALALAALALLALAGGASAKQLSPYQFDRYFDGHDATGGAFSSNMSSMTINQADGRVYVMDQRGGPSGHGEISQFTPQGEAVIFPALSGSSTIETGGDATFTYAGGSIQYDWTPFNGGLYAVVGGFASTSGLRAYNADGSVRFGPSGSASATEVAPITPDGTFLYTPTESTDSVIHKASNGANGNFEPFYEGGIYKVELGDNGFYYFIRRFGEPGIYKARPLSECLPPRYPDSIICERVLQVSYTAPNDLVIDRSTDNFYAIEPPFDRITEYGGDGRPLQTFGLPEGAFAGLSGSRGIAVNEATKEVFVTSLDGSPRVDVFKPGPPVTVPDVNTTNPAHPDASSAVLKGIVNPDGVATTDCKFEWGTTTQYTTTGPSGVPCEQGNVLNGSNDVEATLKVEGLTLGDQYHYRVAARNSDGFWSYSADRLFEGSTAPTSKSVLVDEVNTDGATFHSDVNPHGGTTKWHFEVGQQDCASNPCQSVPAADKTLGSRVSSETISATVGGLLPDTTYFVRLVAENGAGTATPSSIFHTFPSPPENDPCPNAQVRQQTSAYLLPDCRAYELVSAANAGGYDVESSLIPGQTPFAAYPNAAGRLLYGLHYGSVPGAAGSPPNYGVDPYVAERTATGWQTRYVGIPSNGMADDGAFGSPLLGADEQLTDFAFGGPGICDPCFPGLGTNIPVRLDGGAASPGMTGSLQPGDSAPAGFVSKYLSDDGSHLVFGSTKRFESQGVEGALTIYERDFAAGTTEVVSTDEAGTTFSGPGTAALDVSSDGSRVVVGKLVSTDSAGNSYYHLYLHSAGSAASADLTPGGSALFSGMTADGSGVFLTTPDQLLPQDTDGSADVYEATIGTAGHATLRLVSTLSDGTPSNSDSCTPPGLAAATTPGPRSPSGWNAPSGPGNCDAVAFAGGAGVGSGDGTFYFVSPELLDGTEGEADQPNLYVVKHGAHPHFVATIDSSLGKEPPAPAEHPLANGNFAAVPEAESLSVNQANGDVFAVSQSQDKVMRFDSTGAPKNFTAGPGAGTNEIPGFTFSSIPFFGSVAVDNSGGALGGDLYVSSPFSPVTIWAPSGEKLGQLTGSGTNNGSFGFTCGVAVDQTTGSLFVSDYFGYIWKYTPSSPSGELTDADYTVTGIQTTGFNPCSSAVDGNGHVFANNYSDGPLKRFSVAAFAAGPPPGQAGTTLSDVGRAVATDQATHELFVSEGNAVGVFDKEGNRVSTISGEGAFSGARGLAVRSSTGHVFVAAKSAGKIVEFGYLQPAYRPIDNPAIVHAVGQAYVHSYEDFQVTRDGRYAAFNSVVPLTGYENLGHMEIFRYDSDGHEIACASCASTLAPAKESNSLPQYGLGISRDGRVFYTSLEGLVLSDTNKKADAYEWNEGTIGMLSTGQGLENSALLSTSEDGKDAFFFTREQLVDSDENGGAVKIYDAREGGGFVQFAQGQPCAASDECHGAGSRAPAPPNINSLEGPGATGFEPPKVACKKGSVKRKRKCVKKHRKHRRHAHRTRKHG
jgi:hypothetical protein